jgi:succinate dehydrogenase flavin-adding protein (antitoxin of CptAB toxin-antitoxin module)
MLPTTSSPNNHKRRSRCNGSYFASRLIFSKLHRSRVKIPETILIGHDGEIFQWLFWSNESRCLLRKSYETLSEKGHDLILSKFVKRKTSASSTEKNLSIHVLAPGGRAIFDGNGLKKGVDNIKKQHDRFTLAMESGGATIQRNTESVLEHDTFADDTQIGCFIGTKYIEPSNNVVFVVEVIRNPDKPKNMVDARRMGYLQTSFEVRIVEHASAYEIIDSNEALSAWTTLTKPPSTREVRPTYIHQAPHSSFNSSESDYEKFIEYHRSKKRKVAPSRIKKLLERDCEDIFSWLSQQHGMWITHIELEYICEATSVATTNLYAERDKYKGKCYLKAVNFVEYVKCATSRPDALGGVALKSLPPSTTS